MIANGAIGHLPGGCHRLSRLTVGEAIDQLEVGGRHTGSSGIGHEIAPLVDRYRCVDGGRELIEAVGGHGDELGLASVVAPERVVLDGAQQGGGHIGRMALDVERADDGPRSGEEFVDRLERATAVPGSPPAHTADTGQQPLQHHPCGEIVMAGELHEAAQYLVVVVAALLHTAVPRSAQEIVERVEPLDDQWPTPRCGEGAGGMGEVVPLVLEAAEEVALVGGDAHVPTMRERSLRRSPSLPHRTPHRREDL